MLKNNYQSQNNQHVQIGDMEKSVIRDSFLQSKDGVTENLFADHIKKCKEVIEGLQRTVDGMQKTIDNQSEEMKHYREMLDNSNKRIAELTDKLLSKM
jgi:peptidoglycan hydrolase CwlO-like protein